MDAGYPEWPAGLAPYRRTPEFTAQTCPGALRRAHSTKAGVWARLHVLEGHLRFRDIETGEERLLSPGVHPVIHPRRPHEVALGSDTRFFVEFLSRDGAGARLTRGE